MLQFNHFSLKTTVFQIRKERSDALDYCVQYFVNIALYIPRGIILGTWDGQVLIIILSFTGPDARSMAQFNLAQINWTSVGVESPLVVGSSGCAVEYIKIRKSKRTSARYFMYITNVLTFVSLKIRIIIKQKSNQY